MALFGVLVFVGVFSVPVMLIVSLVKLADIHNEIYGLKQKLLELRHAAPEPGPVPEPEPEPVAAPEPAPEPEPEPVAEPPAVEIQEASAVEPEGHDPEPARCRAYEPTAMDLFWSKLEDWFLVRGQFAPEGMSREFAVATRWLVRAGILMIVAALAYFAKLSIDRGWMGPTGRVVATLVWGAVGVVAGTLLVKRTKYDVLGHAVAALGVVALYFGFGLGHRFFNPPVIASAGLAFAALFAVTVCAVALSVYLSSSTIAVLGIVGGYLVPIIAGRDTGSPVGLDAYLLVLNLGAFVVARLRKWSALDFLAAVLSTLFCFVWCGLHGTMSHRALLVNFLFVSCTHLLYMVSVAWDSRGRTQAGNALAWMGLSLSACAYFTWIVTFLRMGFSNTVTGLVLFGVAVVYLSVAALAQRRGWADRPTLRILLVFALADLVVATMFLLGAVWWTATWSILAVALAEASKRTGARILAILSYLVLAAAAFVGVFFAAPTSLEAGWRLADGSCGAFLSAFALRLVRLGMMPAAAVWICYRQNIRELAYLAGGAVFCWYTAEAVLFGRAFLPSLNFGSITLAWSMAAFIGIWFGITRRVKPLRIGALGLLGVSVVKLLLVDTAHLPMPARVGLFALVGVLLLVGAFLYLKNKDRFEIK